MLTPFFTAVCDDNRHICDQGLTDRPPAHLCICLWGEDLLVGESHRGSRPPTWQTPGRPGITSFHILKPKGCPGVGLLDHMVVLFLIFFKNLHTVPQASQVALVIKNLPVNAGDTRDTGSIPRSSPGVGGNPLQYSCLANFMDRGAWWSTVHGVARSWVLASFFVNGIFFIRWFHVP